MAKTKFKVLSSAKSSKVQIPTSKHFNAIYSQLIKLS